MLKKVAGGEATAKEKAWLVEQFEAMAAAKPPKRDEASWKKKTEALVAEAKKAAEGKGTDKRKAAANCEAYHEAHKCKAARWVSSCPLSKNVLRPAVELLQWADSSKSQPEAEARKLA